MPAVDKPSTFRQCKNHIDKFTFFIWTAPDLGSDDVIGGFWRIDDTDHSFSTPPFRIRYARQDIRLAMLVSFYLSLRKFGVFSFSFSFSADSYSRWWGGHSIYRWFLHLNFWEEIWEQGREASGWTFNNWGYKPSGSWWSISGSYSLTAETRKIMVIFSWRIICEIVHVYLLLMHLYNFQLSMLFGLLIKFWIPRVYPRLLLLWSLNCCTLLWFRTG